MGKKRVFIAMHYLEIGGAETALIGMLQAFDYSQYDVDLFLHSHRGEMMNYLPEEVNLLPEIKEFAHIESTMKRALIDGCWKVLYGRLKAKWLTKRYLRKKGVTESAAGLQYIADCVSPFLPSLHQFGEYDVAISFLTPHNYVIEKVNAKKKICWIHTDYSRIDVDEARELSIWSAYDHIISISPDVTKTFLQVFPSLREKIVEVENILSTEIIKRRADEVDVSSEMPKGTMYTNILSIGRFCYQKNLDSVPDICKRILDGGINHKWYLIGYGEEEVFIRHKIAEAGMQDYVFLLGKRENPYPYIKSCDIYVQPSRYEGKSITVREAQILFKPVVITNYPTSTSQIKDGIDGVIVPMDNQGCADGIIDLITNQPKQDTIIQYLHTHDYGNKEEIEKLYRLL